MTTFGATARNDDWNTPSGAAQMSAVVITGIDLDADGGPIAEATLQSTGQPIKVRVDSTYGRSKIPRPGEFWIVTRTFGRWMFTVCLQTDLPRWTDLQLLDSGAQVNTTGAAWTPGTATRGRASWIRDESYVVRLRGAITGVTPSTSDAVAPLAADFALLPDGARPSTLMRFCCVDSDSTTPAQVTAYPDGHLRLTIASGPAAAISLDQVSWLVDP